MIAIAEAVEALEEGVTKAPLFELQFTQQGLPRAWKNILQKKWYSAALKQLRAPSAEEDLGFVVTSALERQEDLNY